MDERGYDGLQAVVFLVGIYEGLLPLVSKVFDWDPFLAFPLRLPDPLWWIVSGAVVVGCAVALELLDRAKKRVG
ncbi:hypothetical protein [Actinokineospora globicatena]|uniref:Uncharacterized protein n=1 Tax=Actinokineospora globicatena TaxID=103729 RepID=A0A9W6VDS2_9PSEU|nr:hypothetical protein [Actinokineospora globicatena]MCP2301796.1 hypothetical protein [Actinokineospora globicatena]GLW76546.1 hypothetical protein Aglo01_10280 [Actinokineospora globicatena]GLW83380.1 hypothetical protein Aglo02_10200 [Actinokineospora globicatena]GLW95586.1 hypothetical protein Aglo03_64020 [Actinokineospora globicatena]